MIRFCPGFCWNFYLNFDKFFAFYFSHQISLMIFFIEKFWMNGTEWYRNLQGLVLLLLKASCLDGAVGWNISNHQVYRPNVHKLIPRGRKNNRGVVRKLRPVSMKTVLIHNMMDQKGKNLTKSIRTQCCLEEFFQNIKFSIDFFQNLLVSLRKY